MLLHALVEYIERNGIDLKIEDGRLRVTGDQSKLTQEVTEAMRAHKQALVAWCGRQARGIARAVPADGSYPLSLAQQRLYFLYQYDPSVTSFILPVELELRGDIDVARFRRAIVSSVERHEIYRAVYRIEDGVPRQRVDSARAFEVEVRDLSLLDADARESAMSGIRTAIAHTPFDLGAEFPLRACIVREADGFHRLVVAMHHIATDDWSIQQFVKDVSDAYRDGGELRAEPTAISYLDYAAWQAETYAQGGYDVSRSYWEANLDGIRGVLELPLDAPRPAVQTFNGATLSRRILPGLAARAATVARELKTSEFSVYLGAFNVLMFKLTGERDIVVGTDVFGRDHADLQAMAGFFVNQVALRSRMDPAEQVGAYLARLGASTLESLRYQDMPFDKLVDALGIERDPAYPPVFQVKFLYDRAPHRIRLFDGVDVRESHAFPVKSQYDVTLKVVGDEIVFYYNTDLFHAEAVALWADLYMAMLERAIMAPTTQISGLLHDALVERLSGRIDGEHVEVDASTLFAGFDRAVRDTPQAVAVRTADGAVTYAELDARIARIGARLIAMGVRKGARVAVHLERSVDLVAAIVATMRCGAVFVPIDPSYPREHIDYTLEDSGAGVVITSGVLAESLSEFYGFVLDLDGLAPAGVSVPSWPAISADDIAYLLYTSGSTGRPKGVLVGYGAFSNLCDWYVRFAGIDARSRVLLMIPIGFDASIKNVVCPLIAGGTVVLARPGTFDPEALLDLIEDAAVSLINCAPSAMNAILKVAAADEYARLSGLDMVALGGEALDIAVFAPWLSSAHCRATLANIYGPTECTDISVAWKADRETWLAQSVAPIGHPIQNTRACIVDADLQLCPPGVAGELLVAGRGVGAGYHGLDEATALSFIDSEVAGGRAYRTGDICRYDAEGRIVYVGRRDGQIKIRGKRVEINEIVAQIAALLPGRKINVQLYAADGLEMLLAFADGGASALASDEIRRELAQSLPRHMVPAQVLFVDALPLTPNGKVDHRALADEFEARRNAHDESAEPLDDVERAIAVVWEKLLGVSGLRKSSDFFALGGDSIFSIQLVATMREHGMAVSVADIFKYPTIEQIAAFIGTQAASADAAADAFEPVEPFVQLDPADRARLPDGLEDAYPVTSLQHGMIFHGLMDAAGTTYHDVFSFELDFDRYEEDAFVRAIAATVARHPVLRTGFDLGRYSMPLQLVHAQVEPNVALIDLRDHDADAQAAEVAATILRLKAEGFDLAGPSLIRFTVLRKAEHCIQLVIDAHHAILDGWSMATLQRQVFETYRALLSGAATPCFDSGASRFADYVALLAREEAEPANRAYWDARAREAGAGRVTEVGPPVAGREHREIRLPDGLAARIDALATREGVPVRTLLFMAHGHAVRTMIGADRIVTGQTDNGRLEVLGSENVLGLFLNVQPQTVDLSGGRWRDLARTLQEDDVASRPHRRYPLAAILQRHPRLAVDTLFTYTNFRVSQPLTREATLRVREGEMFEELNFPLSFHANGNREEGYSVVLDARLNLTHAHMDALLRAYVDALESMTDDFDGEIPELGRHDLPMFRHIQDGALYALASFEDAFDAGALRIAATEVLHRALGSAESLSLIDLRAHSAFEETLDEQAGIDVALSEASAADAMLALAIHRRGDSEVLALRIASRLAAASPQAGGELLARYRMLAGCSASLSARATATSPWRPAAAFDRDRAYWRGRLGDAPFAVELPADRAMGPLSAHGTASTGVPIDASSLRAVVDACGGSREHVLSSAWAVLLSRLSGQHDIVFGLCSPALTARTVPLRVPLDDAPAASALVARIAAVVDDAQAHADLPFAQIVEALHSAGRGLPFNTAVVIDGMAAPGPLDLSLALAGDDARLQYATERFDAGTAARIADHLRQLLEGMGRDATRSVASLPLMSVEARERLLFGFNATATDPPADALVHRGFERQAALQPDAPALIDGDAVLSRAELNRCANRIARRLIAAGVKPDDRVAICAERSGAMVAGLLGILKAGGAYVPLDPAYPAERLAYMLDDSRPVALLTQGALRAVLPEQAGLPVLLLDGALEGTEEWGDVAATDPVVASLDGAHLAQVIYTSGSTGQPKGVMVEHRNVCELIRTHIRNCRIEPGDRMLQFASYSFDSSVVEIFPTLAAGGTLVLRPAQLVAPDEEFVAFLDRNHIDIVDLPTAFWHRWSQDVAEGRFLPPAGLRLVVVGGEKVERRHLEQWLHTPGVRSGLLNTYGPTEACVYATAIAFASGERLASQDVSIGRPVGNTRVYVLDACGEPAPVGVTGELCIAGAQVARGYLGREALSAERFVRDPFVTADHDAAVARMYRTGDLARWREDGTLEFIGRNDFQVKIRGYRIELGEIESALAACAGVREAVVVAREDVPGDRRLVAYVVGDEADVSPVALRGILAKTLAEHMLPSAIVRLDVLPLTANGKIDRHALPAPDDAACSRPYEAPQGDAEVALAEVWAALLGRSRVGRKDHFFELGGHSLIAVQLVTRLRESRGVELSLRDVFARPVLSDMAGALRVAGAASLPPVRPADRNLPLPLSWAQQRLWFLDQLDAAAGAAYHMPAALRLEGRLDRALLQATLDRLVSRHEILRTAFTPGEGEPVQAIAPADCGFALDDVDLSHLPPDQREHEVQALSSAEVRKPFDLSTGPLIRGRLLRLAADEHVLLLTQHHIISDGWSLGVLVDEVSALYAAFAEGRPDSLSPLPVQYADYAVWQREWLRGDLLDAQMGYWRDHLTGAPALLELPTDRPRPAVQSYQGRSLRFRLEKPVVDGLRALSQRHGMTLFMTLLAGWSLLLSRLSGQEDVVVGTAVANRRRRELEPLLGFFVNTLALRVDVAGDPTVAELLARARDVMLGAHEHQDVPFEQVVDMLQPARSLGHNPIVQNMLVLQNTPGGALELPGLRLHLIDQPRDETLFDLSLELIESNGGLDCGLEYASDLFDDATIARWADHLRALLQAMAENDGRRVSTLSMLAPEQRSLVLDIFSTTPGHAVAGENFATLFEAQVARTPDAPAVSHQGVVVTYAELNRRANRIAHRLIALGVRTDDRVAICMPRGIDAIVAVLGVLKSGAGYVPLDPAYPAERLAYLVGDSAPRALLTERALEDAARAFSGTDDAPALLALDDSAAWLDQPETDPVVEGLSPSHLAYVIYTSGSTGQPKGVMVEHRNVLNLWAAFERDVFAECPPAARLALDASLSFDASVQSLVQLLSGRCMVIVPDEIRADGAALVDFLARERIDIYDCTPMQFEALLAGGLLAAGAHRPGVMLIGGEALPARAWDAAAASTMRCYNVYGPTECTVDASVARIVAGVAPHIGRPIANARIYVLGGDGEPQPVGVVGEIHVGGAGVARGYLGRPQLTAERFVRDPYSADPKARVYRTGDLGRWRADGTLEYVGRNDFQVKVRGYRIELGEIEARLSAFGDVREAVVLAREDQAGDKRLVAYIAPRDAAKDEALSELLDGQVAQWSDIFDDQGEEEAADFGFDLTGWNSTFTREAIPSEAMREWLDTTLDRIRELQPRRMLEIGVGTGMILCNIAPGCERFVGTDLSVKTVAKINRLVAATPELAHATVFQSEATDFSRIEGEFDTVVVNSVVQYFPNLGYLEEMIASVIARTAPGGRVMIGDVRHHGLMASFHLAVQAFQSPDTLLSAQLRDRAAQKMRGDIELLVDPVWFHALRERYPRITGVRVLPKIARHENEMSAYRYDVVLTIDGAREAGCPVQWHDWGDGGFDASHLQALVEASAEDAVGLRGIAHPWATPYQRAWQRLSAGEEAGGSVATIKAKVAADGRRGAMVADLVDFCRERGYSIDLSWAPNDACGEYHALIGRKGQALAFDWRTLIDTSQLDKPASAFAHDPLEAKWRSVLPGRLREMLAAQLPDYMVPSAFILIDRWPTTANGKLDVQALPAPDRAAVATRAYEPPQGEVEETIAAIWQELLGQQQVGRHDHFFEVGGHSLLAVQVMARIREAFGVDIHVAELFKSPEVVSLARAVLLASVGRYADEDVARVAGDLDDLSEDELRALLAMEEESSP